MLIVEYHCIMFTGKNYVTDFNHNYNYNFPMMTSLWLQFPYTNTIEIYLVLYTTSIVLVNL